MELVANVWPVYDSDAGLVQRFLMRAYVIDGPDAAISETLRSLAPTDFRVAQAFAVPERYSIVSDHGSLAGCVTLADFHKHQSAILESAFRSLESDYARLQGISQMHGATGDLMGIALIPRFPASPFLLVTALLETPDGQLVPQLPT